MAIFVNILKEILKAVLLSLLTEQFIKDLIVYALETLSKRTDNEVDDRVVEMVKKALEKKPERA
jgi:hypothetical protein